MWSLGGDVVSMVCVGVGAWFWGGGIVKCNLYGK